MKNNLILKKICTQLKLSNEQVIEVFALADLKVSTSEIADWLKESDESGHVDLGNKMMAHFLNALITFKRGKADSDTPRPLESSITNNLVLKKIRIAFNLKEDDLYLIVKKSGSDIQPKEWNPYFRKEGHKNYRDCPDSFLELVIAGL